jgi:hypothetical protein
VKRGPRILGWIAASVALFIAAAISVDAWFDWESAIGLCKVPVRSVTQSPDGKQFAVVFEVYCGPLPPDNTHVSIVPANRSFSWKRDPGFLILAGSGGLEILWTEATSVEVRVPALAKVYKQEPRVGAVAVNYKPVLF